MADHTFHLVIASVGATKYDGRAQSVTLPGSAGVLEILPHHEPLVTTLNKGVIAIKDQSGEMKNIEIESGVLECSSNRVVVLL